MKKSNMLLAILLTTSIANAQIKTVDKNAEIIQLRLAKDYLNGFNGSPYLPDKALKIYTNLAERGNLEALNALGVVYAKGIGVEASPEKSFNYELLAAKNGFEKAYTNLAKMYKEGYGVTQNFEEAYYWFNKASQSKSDFTGKFFKAYFLYKGLAVKQDYDQAFQLFKPLAKNGFPNAMYFLALCYRNGYGVERNIELAKSLLQKAADKGSLQAQEELQTQIPENPLVEISNPAEGIVFNSLKQLSEESDLLRIKHNVNIEDLSGSFSGYAIRYDWSKKHIISYYPLKLEVKVDNNTLKGNWFEGDSSTSFEAFLNENNLNFSNTEYKYIDHYNPADSPDNLMFKNSKLELVYYNGKQYMAGFTQLYGSKLLEPSKPMYIYLSRNTPESIKKKTVEVMRVFPNPTQNQITAQFTVETSLASSIQIRDIQGHILQNQRLGNLLSGTYKKTINTKSLLPGSYILVLTSNEQIISKSIFIKN